jgi:AraC-like DNA-binding protein
VTNTNNIETKLTQTRNKKYNYQQQMKSRKYKFAEKFNTLFEKKKLFMNPKLTIIDLAKEMGTNRTYISDYLNKDLNTTFFDYVNQRRIQESELMLRTTKESLENISSQSGFNSPSTFRRAFMKKYNCTPGKYRIMYRKSQKDNINDNDENATEAK